MNKPSHRAGWRWLLPRILNHYRPRQKKPFSPDRTFCRGEDAGGDYVELQPPTTHRFPPLPIRPSSATWLWSKTEEIATGPWYRLELSEGQVWGPQGWVGNRNGDLISDVFGEPTLDDWRVSACAMVRTAADPAAPQRYLSGTTATLAMPNHTNYFHWLWQGLPRVDFFKPIADRIDQWIVPSFDRPYVAESLRAAGIDLRKVIPAGPGGFRCEKLCVTTQPASASLRGKNGWPASFLQSLFCPTIGEAARQRIFVVRGAVSARQLINEGAVSQLLAQHGFVTKSMDGLTIAEQAALFNRAEAVVAVHGAAMANLAFCRTGTKFLELLPRNWPSPLYGRLAEELGLRYQCLAGCEPALRWAPITNLSADLQIDLNQLKELLGRKWLTE